MKAKGFIQAVSDSKKIKARVISDPVSVVAKTIKKHERMIGEGLVKYRIIMRDYLDKAQRRTKLVPEEEYYYDSVDDGCENYDSLRAPYRAVKGKKNKIEMMEKVNER